MAYSEYPEKKKVYWSVDEAKINIRKYCAFQERSHKEVRYKLIEHSVYGDVLEEIIADLISENFLDEERFAKTFARGKFRMKQWGRNKIIQELKNKDVSPYSIREAMKEINEDDYLQTLEQIIAKKERTTKFINQYDKFKKLTNYALSKGYEYELIAICLNKNI